NLADFKCSHDTRGHASTLQRILQSQGVDDSCQHAHVIALPAVHPLACAPEPTENIASTDDKANLHARFANSGDFFRGGTECVDVKASLARLCQGFAAQLE